MIYTVTGNPCLDYVMCIRHLTPGSTNRSTGESLTVGGKGINVSMVLQTLGVTSTALGFVAGFTGKEIERAVNEAGIQADFVRLGRGNSRINLKLKGAKETEINAQGPYVDIASREALQRRIDRIMRGDTLILAGSLPPSMPANSYETWVAQASARGVRVVVDVSGEALRQVLPHRPFLIKPNRDELSEVSGRPLTDKSQIIQAAQTLQTAGARNVLVSLGADGALLVAETGEVMTVPAYTGVLKNSVGAGDSMVAGFLVGFDRTGDYGEALRMGNAAGGATSFSDGLATRAEISRLLWGKELTTW